MSSRPAPPQRQAVGLLAAAALIAVISGGCVREPPPVARADDAIVELRRSGQFAAALAEARRDLERVTHARRVPAWRVTDARLAVSTLAGIVALPDSARRQLAAVEGLVPARVGTDGDWRALVPALERQLAVRSRWLGETHADVADTRSALGRLEWALGNSAAARADDERALSSRRHAFGDLHPAVVESYRQLGKAYKLAGMDRLATTPYYERALALGRRVYAADSPELATLVLEQANFCRWTWQRERGDRLFAEALRIRRALYPGSSAHVAEVLSDWGVTCAFFDDFESAARFSRQALAILDRSGGWSGATDPIALSTLGMALERTGHPAEALPYLERAASAQEARRRAARRDQGRSKMFPLVAWFDCAVAQVQLGDSARAFESFARGLSRGVLDRAMERGEIDSTNYWEGLLARVQRDLPDTTAMIGWLESPSHDGVGTPFWCFVIRRSSGIHWTRVDDAGPRGQAWADQYLSQLRNRLIAAGSWPVLLEVTPDLDSLAVNLWHWRIAPMEDRLRGVRELVVVSPNIDCGVPIEMLHGPGQPPLAERFPISYVPSPVTYAAHRERPSGIDDPRRWRALLVGSSGSRPGDDAHRGLAQVANDVRNVRAAFPSARVLIGGEASEARMNELRSRHELERFDLIHFSGHQRSDPIFALDAGVVLAEAYARPPAALPDQVDTADGRITPSEVESWRLNARLVVLASCQSIGVGGSRSEGIVGMGQSMLEAGAGSVVVSLWNVDDRATHLLVERFYEELIPRRGRARTFAEALRLARLHVRDWRKPDGSQPYRHPAYWAAFALLGDPY